MGRRIAAMVLAAATVLLPTVALARPAAAAGVARVSVVPNPARPGQQVTIVGSGCKAGELVGLSWRPYPKTASVANLPSTTARADGTFRTTWAIPTLMRPGTIAIDAYCGQHGPGSETVLTVASTTTSSGTLPFTGPRNAALLLSLGLGLLGAGVGAFWLGRRRTHRNVELH